MVSAGSALATTELVSALLDRHRPTVTAAVASRLVTALSGPLRRPAINTFGRYDKNALIVGIVVVSLLLGVVLGLLARRWSWVLPAGLAAGALAGALAAWRDPLAVAWTAALAGAVGTASGFGTWHVLTRPTPVDLERRVLFARFGALGLGALAAAFGAQLAKPGRRSVAAGALPRPAKVTPVPAAELATPGITPYVTPNDSFYRIDTAIFVPDVDVDTWTLRISGLVDRPQVYTYQDLLDMDLVEEPITMCCVSNDVGGHLVGNARWLGVPLRRLLDAAGVHPDADQIVGRAVDGFTVNVRTADALDGRPALVAVGMNGSPLPGKHGYPARLVIAGFYGYASATKWLKEIELTRRGEQDSYWVDRGWAKDGPIKTQSRIDVPASGASVAAGTVTIAGVAWSPPQGIGRVEVAVDDGPWHEATLGAVASSNTWVQWSWDWVGAPAGTHVAVVRATDGNGVVQTDVPTPPEPSGATGWHYRGFTVV
jgi:DMSO/TMAO reductase YedYZ molybdopterin-dependent catalytic subunit